MGRDAYAADGVAIAEKLSGAERKVVQGEVRLIPKPNATYVVKGQLGKKSSSIWIEDSTNGEIVTEIVKSGQ